MDYAKASRALRICESVFNQNYTKYFLCFGNILHLIRDKSIEPDKDIDIGVFYDVADEDKIIRGFGSFQYVIDKRIEHDITHKALYLSFKHETLPPIDVFFWLLNEKIYYHTYDFFQEGRAVPSKYCFKGVPMDIMPDRMIPSRQDPKMIKSFFGPWNKPYFQFEVPIPLFYGSLMDLWYPNWLKPRKQESLSPYTITLKSCANFIHVTKEMLAESERVYEEKKRQLA